MTLKIYGFCSLTPSSCAKLQRHISECIDGVVSWLRSSRLQLNTSKTEIIWLSSMRRSFQLPQQPSRVVNDQVAPVHMVRDLGIFIDTDVQMKSHVVKTTAACSAVLCRLHSIRRSVPRPVLQSLLSCLVLSRLDDGNAVLAGISVHLLKRLQSVLNSAARLVFSSSKFD